MKEDLRYLESLIEEIDHDSHPSNQTLSDFINKKLNEEEREEILEHLVHCHTCSDTIINTPPSNIANNTLFKPLFITPLVAIVATFIIFVNFPQTTDIERLGSEVPLGLYKGNNDSWAKEIVDADKILAKIEQSVDLSSIESFSRARAEEQNANFTEAKELYDETFNHIIVTEPQYQKRLQSTIIIYNRLLQIAHQEGNQKNLKKYKEFLRYKVREYNAKYNN